MPVADSADQVSHNTKIYNLSRMRLLGFEGWGKEAAKIYQTYFRGKFAYGKEPVFETEPE